MSRIGEAWISLWKLRKTDKVPGNLAAAIVVGVLPQSLSTAFAESRIFPLMAVDYHDGTNERSIIQDGVNAPVSYRSWKQSKRLTTAQLSTLRTFYEAHNGGLVAFYWYNPFEPTPGQKIGSNYDATGVSTQGRYTVVFRGDWAEHTELGRSVTGLELMKVA